MSDRDADSLPVVGEFDEELAPPARPPGPRWRTWAVAGGIAVLVAGALVARAVGDRGGSRPQGAPASSALSSASYDPRSPELRGPPRITTGPRRLLPPQFRPAGCPADAATCLTTYGLPDAALTAVLEAFPHAVLTDGVSLLAERTGRFGPDLVSRAFHARSGTTEVSVYISKPASAAAVSRSNRTYGKVSTTTSLRQSVPGFVVSIDVTQPARNLPVAMDYLVRFAADDGLVEPQ